MSCWMFLRLHNGDLRRSLLPVCCSLSLRALSSGAISRSLRESYRILQLPDDGASDAAEVKEAHLRMAKLYHPDSGVPTADAALFSQIERAYRAVLAHLAKQKSASQYTQSMEEEEEDKI